MPCAPVMDCKWMTKTSTGKRSLQRPCGKLMSHCPRDWREPRLVNEVDVVGIGLGDLLRAFTLLRPDDEPSRSAIARMLGFGWQDSEFTLKPDGPGMNVPRIQPDPDPEPEPEPSP